MRLGTTTSPPADTTAETTDPAGTREPAIGSCVRTIPDACVDGWLPLCTSLRFTWATIAWAVGTVCCRSSGTATEVSTADTFTVTVEPTTRDVPAAGVWSSTIPAGVPGTGRWPPTASAKPTFDTAAFALSTFMPTMFGTG